MSESRTDIVSRRLQRSLHYISFISLHYIHYRPSTRQGA